MDRREFIKSIFIVAAVASAPTLVISDAAPDFGSKIGEIRFTSQYLVDKISWLHNADVMMCGEHWNAPILTEGEEPTEAEMAWMVNARDEKWKALHREGKVDA